MEDREIDALLSQADELARSRLSEGRYDHTVRVALTAERLARVHGAYPKKAKLSGLLHDAAREVKKDDLLKLAEEWNVPFGDFERENPKLLHGPVAAELARRELGVEDQEILDAVRDHTVGKSGMGELSLTLYLADKIEPERDYPSVEKIRKLAEESLKAANAEALRRAISYSESRGKTVHPASYRMLEWLEESQSRPDERV